MVSVNGYRAQVARGSCIAPPETHPTISPSAGWRMYGGEDSLVGYLIGRVYFSSAEETGHKACAAGTVSDCSEVGFRGVGLTCNLSKVSSPFKPTLVDPLNAAASFPSRKEIFQNLIN